MTMTYGDFYTLCCSDLFKFAFFEFVDKVLKDNIDIYDEKYYEDLKIDYDQNDSVHNDYINFIFMSYHHNKYNVRYEINKNIFVQRY